MTDLARNTSAGFRFEKRGIRDDATSSRRQRQKGVRGRCRADYVDRTTRNRRIGRIQGWKVE